MADEYRLGMLAPPSRILSEHIANQLRQAIVTDELRPGQRIVEREIAEAMDTSRGPVRDALLLLENEGLVIRFPHRGTFVARLTPQDAEEIYSLRQAIEELAVEFVIKKASESALDELDALTAKMGALTGDAYDPVKAAEMDLAFHRHLCRLSGHSRALSAWDALSAQTRILLINHRKRKPHEFEERAVAWHNRLVAAMRQRDVDLAQAELHKHLATNVEGIIDSFDFK